MEKHKKNIFVCTNCGNEFSKWVGQCSFCGDWNSLKEVKLSSILKTKSSSAYDRKLKGIKVSEVESEIVSSVIDSKITELNRVLGKGIVRGSVVLFSGEPGIGKSTLLTDLLGNTGGLYVAGEESEVQVASRASRLGVDVKDFEILGTNSIDSLIDYVERVDKLYNLMVVDSIQMMYTSGAVGVAGSPSQIRECTFKLIELAKRKKMPIVVVGHVTKGGNIAGPKLLEHMVDVVLYLEGEKLSDLRILRASKNRFGSTEEIGVFRMKENGLKEIKSDEIDLVSSHESKVGSAVTLLMDGGRPILTEIQALVVETFSSVPKRNFVGVDYNRGQMLLAIIQKYLGVPLYKYDVYVQTVGGMKISDTAVDLAFVVAAYSSYKNKVAKDSGKSVWVGELSLLGEVRGVGLMEKRKKESVALGRELQEIKAVSELKRLFSNS